MNKVFVYGSLKKGYSNHAVMGDSTFIKEASLKGFCMHSLGAYPALVPQVFNPDNEHPQIVHGELYEVSDAQMPRINRLEGYDPDAEVNGFYDRETVRLESGESAYVF